LAEHVLMTRNTSVQDLELVAGDASLDLANTMSPRFGDRLRDHLRSYQDLLVWACRVGELSAAEVTRLAKLAETDPSAALHALTRIKGLREAIYAVFSAVAARQKPPPQAFEQLREAIDRGVGHRVLHSLREGGAIWTWQDEPADLGAIGDHLAWGAAELLVDPSRIARIKECPGEDCGWLFVDTTKNGARMWCSSRDCGNRSKIHRYRQRQAAIAAASDNPRSK
jgi:predicted RNA-binding Zn ribbon-like protein